MARANSKSISEFPQTSTENIRESAEKLEYATFDFPKETGQEVQEQLEREKIWLEEMTERTERGIRATILIFIAAMEIPVLVISHCVAWIAKQNCQC